MKLSRSHEQPIIQPGLRESSTMPGATESAGTAGIALDNKVVYDPNQAGTFQYNNFDQSNIFKNDANDKKPFEKLKEKLKKKAFPDYSPYSGDPLNYDISYKSYGVNTTPQFDLFNTFFCEDLDNHSLNKLKNIISKAKK